jgi:hypothetical protein
MTTRVSLKRLALIGGVLATLLLVVAMLVRTSSPIELPELLHINKTPQGEFLEVPVVSYVKGAKSSTSVLIDFVGAVHVGERSYYDDLNEAFKRYDVVLYELVSDGDRIPERRPDQPLSLLGFFQQSLGNLLGLTFQLDEIDYRAPNFVHADLSPHELQVAMTARGESVPQLLFKLIKASNDPEVERSLKEHGFSNASLEGVNPLLVILRGPTADERRRIKRFMAQGLVASDSVLAMLEGEDGLSIITDRNNAIITDLNAEIAQGKKKIAIFYGVGHLPNLHKRLTEGLGFSIVAVRWNKAWDL